jgi:hypothetical protein
MIWRLILAISITNSIIRFLKSLLTPDRIQQNQGHEIVHPIELTLIKTSSIKGLITALF